MARLANKFASGLQKLGFDIAIQGGEMITKSLKFLAVLVLSLTLITPALGQRHKSKGSGPHYGGGHHTKSHGGTYAGSTNSHHKGGHYRNPRTNNKYGHHKP